MKISVKSGTKSTLAVTPKVKFGPTSQPRSGLTSIKGVSQKRDYKKKGNTPGYDFGNVNFGLTGLTGES